jgi:hypothetical protein
MYHTALLLALIAGSGCFAVLAAVFAAAGRRLRDGSVFAGLLRAAMPTWRSLLAVSAGWYALMESLEPKHAGVGCAVVAAALLIVTALIAALADRLIDAIACIVIGVARPAHRERLPFVRFLFAPPPSARAVAFAYRRFARPPPF